MPRATPQRSCLELGVCNSAVPDCLVCPHSRSADPAATTALAASAQARRNAGCHVLLDDAHLADLDTTGLTPMERIAYWVAVGCAVGLSLVAVFGTAGYLTAKALAL